MTDLLPLRIHRFGRVRLFAVMLLLGQLLGCAHQPSTAAVTSALLFSAEVGLCRERLLEADATVATGLDPSNISLFNWNVRKTREVLWRTDFEQYANNADLVLFQEASLREENIADLDSSKHWTFAPGYRSNGEVTGVMTLSNVRPLTQCSFTQIEPLLRTPKATSVMQYPINHTQQTLIVINVHAVNFSLGLGAFERQFEQIQSILDVHEGPVILSGDFNTWRKKRLKVVDALAASLGLTAVDYADDHRVRVFGNAIDHIYTRGLYALNATTEIVKTSDHNPMTAVFSTSGGGLP